MHGVTAFENTTRESDLTDVVTVEPELIDCYIDKLASFGAYGETGVWRVAYSPEWVAAQQQVAEWCDEIGIPARQDAVGNVWGRFEGSEPGRVIATGSHIDSQTPGGRFDGALGIVAALSAVRKLKEQLGQPRHTIEVVSLCEEEASRFHAANFWGSRAITGNIRPEYLTDIRDADGTSIGEAMTQVGLDPSRYADARRDDIDTFIELHIEQGPILEEEDKPVGVVRAISGIRHYAVTLTGRADHAGARPMKGRLDPMPGMAEIVLGVIDNALKMGHPAVTSVGRMAVFPDIPASVPDSVHFTIDARHPDRDRQQQLFAQHEEIIKSVAAKRGLQVEWDIVLDLPPCPCEDGVVQTIRDAAKKASIPSIDMVSGAVHDTQRMATIAKTAMIFVKSKDGRSHTPEEFTSSEDAAAGATVLANTLKDLAYDQ
jgi:allantoate deiminase